MNSNYGWQKQQANEHLQARRREAHNYRLAKQDEKEDQPSHYKGVLAFLFFLFLVVVGFLLPSL